MGFERGISANILSGVQNSIQENDTIQIGRVTDIILNSNYPNINEYGDLNAIGTIFYEVTSKINSAKGIAKPFYPQISSYPLVNELVLLFKLPNTNTGNGITQDSYYYINMVNLWNHPHHNAYPNPINSTLPPSQQKDYQQTQAGSVRRVTDESTEIKLNSPNNPSQDTFIERTNIHSLLPFAGDNIFQGRWGNSIRLGSTAIPKNGIPLNNWSNSGESGDPLTIFRNGQPLTSTEEGWVPITENINKDLASIYLTSTQKIPIELSSGKNFSYSTPPIQPNQYIQPQILLNSSRLILNAQEDGVLISSEKYIGLSSNNSVNIDAKEFHVDSATIKLGSKNATEPLVKGETLYKNLTQMVDALITLVDVMEVQQLWPGGIAAPDGITSITATTTKDVLNHVKKDLVNIKSKTSKTI